MSDDVAELTSIISNQSMPEKKLKAALVKWAQRECQAAAFWQSQTSDAPSASTSRAHTPDQASPKRRSGSKGMFAEVERQLAAAARYQSPEEGGSSPTTSAAGSSRSDSQGSPRMSSPRTRTLCRRSTGGPVKIQTEPSLNSIIGQMMEEDKANQEKANRRRSKGEIPVHNNRRRRASEPMLRLPTVLDEAPLPGTQEVRSIAVSDELARRRAHDRGDGGRGSFEIPSVKNTSEGEARTDLVEALGEQRKESKGSDGRKGSKGSNSARFVTSPA
eukprot:gnl/MRDRNA2_/MRDRNA2_231581_c0_seq1.p1 gnl/MRDRNA2_/MRDRNA2_231581_c0~~gnl/MRDRNA2_/MRDRNA2_231581_c0_seq1.p1  ORF type:complete len:315 (-),score=53.98 gnl/MRDRNA2_/MRDRNA2_231581_c0_seq1:81-902(-)